MIASEFPFHLVMIIVTTAMLSVDGRSQEQVTGKITEPYLGISFTVPDLWTAYKTEIGYLMVSESEKGFVLVMQHSYNSIQELRNAAMEGIADESGTNLQPEGNPEQYGETGLSIKLTGYVEWQQAKAYALALLSPHGGGITILTAVEPQTFSQKYIELVQTIAQGVEFSKPETPPVVDQWKNALTGMRLTYMHTYSSGTSGGFSDKIVIDLCPNGTFSYSSSHNLSVDTGGAFGYSHGKDGGAGTWDIINVSGHPALQLSFHDGSVKQHMISLQGDSFYLDNTRYFRTRDAQCW
jgi:hypothetical protein